MKAKSLPTIKLIQFDLPRHTHTKTHACTKHCLYSGIGIHRRARTTAHQSEYIPFFEFTGWKTHRRAQCNCCCRICNRFDVRTRSNKSRKLSAVSFAHRIKPWTGHCGRDWRSKATIRYLEQYSECGITHGLVRSYGPNASEWEKIVNNILICILLSSPSTPSKCYCLSSVQVLRRISH